MNSAIVIDSGSRSRPAFTLKPPTDTHVNSSWENDRLPADRPSSDTNKTADTAKAAVVIAVASQPAQGSPSRRPETSSSAKPVSGSAGMSQAAWSTRLAPQ